MGSVSVEAVKWALYDAPMLLTAAGKPDTTARFVLAVFAERASKDGRDAFPGPAFVKHATGLDVRTVERAVRRLENAELLLRDGMTSMGAVRWRLDLTLKRPATDWAEIEAALAAEREATAARVRKHRTKGDVTDSASVTGEPVTDSASVRNGRSVRSVTDAVPGEPPVEPPGEPFGGHAFPRTPLRTESPQAAPRTDLGPEPDSSKTSPAKVDQESPVPHARELAPAVDLEAPDSELDAEEVRQRVEALKAHDVVRFRNTRVAARRALGLAGVATSNPRQREALNREIYRAYRAEAVTSNA